MVEYVQQVLKRKHKTVIHSLVVQVPMSLVIAGVLVMPHVKVMAMNIELVIYIQTMIIHIVDHIATHSLVIIVHHVVAVEVVDITAVPVAAHHVRVLVSQNVIPTATTFVEVHVTLVNLTKTIKNGIIYLVAHYSSQLIYYEGGAKNPLKSTQ